MNKIYVKKLLSLIVVLMLIFPVIGFASSDLTIKSVYFQNEDGNMVFVDYEEAIRQSLGQEHTLYNAIKEYVGIAEAKGRPLYLETNTGKILDYGKAMVDNLFKLKDIVGIEKYEVKGKIEFSHELKVVNGKAVIVKKGEEPDPDVVELVSVTQVDDITVKFGTTKQEALGLLQSTTTIRDSKGSIHTVDLRWTINDYDGNQNGKYNATGRFDLPEGMKNSAKLELEVKAIVTVLASEIDPDPVDPDWPIEVKDVFVGTSQITKNTYANIEIKVEYVSVVNAVYLDGELANNIETQPSQWRVIVADGTAVEDLKGRISVNVEEEEEKDIVSAVFNKDSLLGEGFGLGKFVVSISLPKDYKDVTQYAVKYTVGSSDTAVTTDMVALGNSPGELVQHIEGINIVSVILYDSNGSEIATIADVMNK